MESKKDYRQVYNKGHEPIVDRELELEDMADVLEAVLNFTVDEDGVIYDENGLEFHGIEENTKWELSTVREICRYVRFRGVEAGKANAKFEMRKALGL